MAVNGIGGLGLFNIPFQASLSAGQWWLGMHTLHNMTNVIQFRNVQVSWNGGNGLKSGFGDTSPGNNNANNGIVIGLGEYTSSAANAMATSLQLPDDVFNENAMPRHYYNFK